jgi:hypothetical protein
MDKSYMSDEATAGGGDKYLFGIFRFPGEITENKSEDMAATHLMAC